MNFQLQFKNFQLDSREKNLNFLILREGVHNMYHSEVWTTFWREMQLEQARLILASPGSARDMSEALWHQRGESQIKIAVLCYCGIGGKRRSTEAVVHLIQRRISEFEEC